MNKKVTDLQAENKSQEAEIERLAQLEIMHRTELEGKELAITSQCDTTEQMIKDFELLKSEHQRVLQENDELRGIHCAPKLRRTASEETIRLITRSKKKTTTNTVIKCEMASCTNENETAAIKCNACGTWVCETCSDVPIAKLKPVMNKCHSVYYACQGCASAMLHSHSGKQRLKDDGKSKTGGDQHTITLLQDGESSLLAKIENLFENKFTEIKSNIRVLEEKIEDKCGVSDGNDGVEEASASSSRSYAKAVGSSEKYIANAIRQVKNDDKLEELEIEKRAKNIIIHGAAEVGNNQEEVKAEDKTYVLSILNKLGISVEPSEISRLGKPDDNKMRPLKISLLSKDDKLAVMNNLNQLKGTVDEFGKISIKDDYTQSEREEIRQWVKKAQQKTAEDPDKTYRVRGDPKNGLKLIWFAKRN